MAFWCPSPPRKGPCASAPPAPPSPVLGPGPRGALSWCPVVGSGVTPPQPQLASQVCPNSQGGGGLREPEDAWALGKCVLVTFSGNGAFFGGK